ncbi:MAG: hypothetical protein GEV11_29275 [Streptosporangiales bacterium]|nr:hypothetical protein [Streptosporangiales bacterium]
MAAMETLVAELPEGDPRGPFELGSAHDSVGHEARRTPATSPPDLRCPGFREHAYLGAWVIR